MNDAWGIKILIFWQSDCDIHVHRFFTLSHQQIILRRKDSIITFEKSLMHFFFS